MSRDRAVAMSEACLVLWLVISTATITAGSFSLFGWAGLAAGPVHVSAAVAILRTQYYLATEDVLREFDQ